jgi:hypothetical protein
MKGTAVAELPRSKFLVKTAELLMIFLNLESEAVLSRLLEVWNDLGAFIYKG